MELLSQSQSIVLQRGYSDGDAVLHVAEMIRRDSEGPKGQSTGSNDQNLADAVLSSLFKHLLDMFMGGEDRVHGQQCSGRQHRGDAQTHVVRELDEVFQVMNHQVLDVPVRYALVRVQDHSVPDFVVAVLRNVSTERFDHACYLVAGEQSRVPDSVVRQGYREIALQRHFRRQTVAAGNGRQAGQAWRTTRMITSTCAHDADTGPVRRNIRNGHVETEHPFTAHYVRALDRHLLAQLVHLLLSVTG